MTSHRAKKDAEVGYLGRYDDASVHTAVGLPLGVERAEVRGVECEDGPAGSRRVRELVLIWDSLIRSSCLLTTLGIVASASEGSS